MNVCVRRISLPEKLEEFHETYWMLFLILFLFLVKESALILLQTVPTHIQVAALKDKLVNEVSILYGLY